MKISILYWIIGILYLIFDLELIFLFPFSTILFHFNSVIAFLTLMFFLFLLTLAFIFEFLKGGLELI
jgi:NADH-quinone oxidoreductase subunit A